MKLSALENTGIVSELKVKNGKVEKKQSKIDSEDSLIIYDISSKLDEIKDCILGMKSEATTQEVMFALLPHVTNLEVDIDLTRWLKMFNNPTVEMMELVNSLMDTIDTFFEKAALTNEMNRKKNAINEKMDGLGLKSLEQERDMIVTELPSINDKGERKKLFKRLDELNKLIGE